MVWGCFHGRTKGHWVPIPKSITGIQYLRLIIQYLVQVIRSALQTNISYSFQQDNAPVHKARIVMDCLNRNNMDLEDHSFYSHDLNPIEHVWVKLKNRLPQPYPKIADTKPGKSVMKKKLARVLPLVWETIPAQFFEKQ